MNKFSIIAETIVLGWSAAEARESWLRRCFKNVRSPGDHPTEGRARRPSQFTID